MYADDEKRSLLAFALSVYSDPNASPTDRAAAHRRLTADTRKPDMSKLTAAQLIEFTNAARIVSALLAVSRGDAYKAPTLAPMPLPMIAPPTPFAARSEPAVATTSAPDVTTPIAAEPAAPEQPPAVTTPSEPRRFKLADLAFGKR